MSTMRMTKPAPTAAPAPKSEPESVPRARSSWDRAAGRGHSAAGASQPPAQGRWLGPWSRSQLDRATSPRAAEITPVVQRAVAPEAASELVAGVTASSPADASEREAERVSRAIVRMPPPALPAPAALALRAHSASLQRRAVGELAAPAEDVGARLYRARASGAALPASARAFMEPRFGADFGAVRVHADGESAALAAALGARAFTHGAHVFFGRGAFRPETEEGRELIAHELVHVVQQRAAGPARAAVGISQWSPLRVQRLGLRDVVERLGESAANVPGFTMLTLVLGFNPLTGRVVARDATTLLRALAGMVPGGEALFQALSRHGVIERAGAWAREELGSLRLDGAVVRRALERFVASLGLGDLLHPSAVLGRARRLFAEPVGRVVAFALRLGAGALRLLRSAALRPLMRLAELTRGYEVLRLVLERDPLTGEAYPRTAERMIGGFLRLIGEQEKWAQLQQARAVPRTWAWLQQESPAVLALVHEAPPTFARAWESLEARDLLDLGGAFLRVRGLFMGFVGRLGAWARRMGLQAVTFMLEVLAPNAMPILRRAASVVQTIARDPVRFAGHLVRAAKQGFQRFVSHIGTHLRAGLVGWLTGALGGLGIQLPAQWDVRGILSVALQVLGITWPGVRQKLVRHLGERVVSTLETTFELVSTLVREGPAAAWRRIAERLGNVQERVLGQVREWVARTVVGRAVLRIALMLNPAGAVIQALLTTYESVMFFRERATQILQVVESLFDSLGRIASGDVSGAAAYVEATMARTVPVVISFLARLLNLGGITDRIQRILRSIREPVDRALDHAVEWVVAQARRLGRTFLQAGVPRDPNQRLRLGMNAAVSIVNALGGRELTAPLITRAIDVVRIRYGFQFLRPVLRNHEWWVEGRVNPPDEKKTAQPDLRELPGFRNSIKRTIQDVEALLKKGRIQTALNEQPDMRATINSDLATVRTSFQNCETALNDLKTGNPKKSIEEYRRDFRAASTKAEQIRARLQDLTWTPEQREQQERAVRAGIRGEYNRARRLVPSVERLRVLNLEQFKEQKQRLTNRFAAVEAALAADSPTRGLLQLRQDARTTNDLLQDAIAAADLDTGDNAINEQIVRIDRICAQTTTEGRPNASVAEGSELPGSSEAAAIRESRTGEQVGGAWHGPKCADDSRGLALAISVLNDLAQGTNPTMRASINAAIAKASTRREALNRGADAWDNSPFNPNRSTP